MAKYWNNDIWQINSDDSSDQEGLSSMTCKYPALLIPFWIPAIIQPSLAALYNLILTSSFFDMIVLCMNKDYPKDFRHAIAYSLGHLLLKNPQDFVPDLIESNHFSRENFTFPNNYNNAALILPNDKFPTGQKMGIVLATLQEFRRAFERIPGERCKLQIYEEINPENILITRGYCHPSDLYVQTTENTMLDFCEPNMNEEDLRNQFIEKYCQGTPRSLLHRRTSSGKNHPLP